MTMLALLLLLLLTLLLLLLLLLSPLLHWCLVYVCVSRLVKLVMFSGAVHMACFGSLSSLKFAVGSVQARYNPENDTSTVGVSGEELRFPFAASITSRCFVLLCNAVSDFGWLRGSRLVAARAPSPTSTPCVCPLCDRQL